MAEARQEGLATAEAQALQAIAPLPDHVAIIMDGNGRWARQRHLPTNAGHRAGTQNARRVIQGFADYGIRHLTLFAFSAENWGRSQAEIGALFSLLREVIDKETGSLHEAGVQVRHLGSMERVPRQLREAIQRGVELTRNNQKMILNIAFNYGGRQELVSAVQRIVQDGIPPEAIDSALINRYLYTSELPDPDLIIRTGGEMRLSNFLIWQAAYAEYYSTPTLWPDFDLGDVQAALLAYSRRERRFGGRDSE